VEEKKMKEELGPDDLTILLVSIFFKCIALICLFLFINLYLIQELDETVVSSSPKAESSSKFHESFQFIDSWDFKYGSQQFGDDSGNSGGLQHEFEIVPYNLQLLN
jgi:hypothetical protein